MPPPSVEPVESEDTSVKAESATSSPQQIPYESALSPISRRQFRLLFLLTMINTLLLFFFVAGPGISRMTSGWWQDYKQWRADRAAAQQKAQAQQKFAADFKAGLQFSAPENQVIYEEDASRAAKLLAAGSDYGRVKLSGGGGTLFTPAPWQYPVMRKSTALPVPFQDPRDAAVFLHSRITPGGVERVVRVELTAETAVVRNDFPGPDHHYSIYSNRIFVSQALRPKPDGLSFEGSMSRALSVIRPTMDQLTSITWIAGADGKWETGTIQANPKNVMRVFAGQPDPKNAAHFTIAYELDGKPGIIDGWLLNDETVALQPRNGRIVREDDSGRDRLWDPQAVSPATRPLAPPDLPPAPVRKS